jgi:hypothetical protein
VSMAYTFPKVNAGAKSRRYLQYFEMFGNRALYYDGWIACARHGRLPWMNVSLTDFDEDRWELYDIEHDFSESEDLAAANPAKLRQLQDMFVAEAAKHDVFPLDDRLAERLDVTLRPSFFFGRKHVTFYPGMVRLPEGSAPKTNNVTHAITVPVEIPADGAEGVLVCVGGDTAGWSLYVLNDKLIYHYNWFDTERYEAVSSVPIPSGKVELKAVFINETDRLGGPANVTLFINGEAVGEVRIEKQVMGRFSVESLDVGMDALSPVSKAYAGKSPFPFTGTIEHVAFDFGDGVELTPKEKLALHVAMD